jgi:tetratricopeptide (TPR) repeat protein/TolB-like protein
MSPEQILQPQAVGPSSDIYALGCLAFEALTGRLPFRASTRGGVVGRKIQGGEALGAGLAGLDRSVRAALTRAVDPDPSLRHPRASDLVAELRRAVGKRPRRLARFALTAAVAMLAVTAWTVWPRAPALDPERVVVGPVVNETGNPELDPLASSVVDYLTRGIQGTGLVRVIPTETALSSARYALSGRGTGDPIAALAEETGAGVVVSGRIFEDGGEIGLSLQINDAIHGDVQSALEPVSRPPQEAGLLRLLEETGDRLFGSLALILDERVEAFADAADPPPFRVYRMFSEGLDRYLAADWDAAAELFLEAHRADASFVTPVLYAALSHSNMGAFAVEDSLLRAASGDPWSLTPFEWGWIQYRLAFLAGDRAAALQAIRAVAAAAPGSKAVYNYGVEAMEGRRLREAVDALESLPPDRGPVRGSVGHLGALAVSHHALGDEDQARRAASGLQEIHPDLLLPRQLACGPLAASDRLDILHAELDRVAAQGTDATGLTPGEVLVDCALELRAHGHPEASRSAVAQALAWFEERGWQELPDRALIAAGDAFGLLGRWDRAADVGARVLERQATGRIRLDALALVGRAAAARGDVATAEDIRDRLAGADGAFRFGYHLYAASLVEASLGRTAAALALLRRAFAEGLHFGAYLHLHPALDPLRREPGFQRLIEPVA